MSNDDIVTTSIIEPVPPADLVSFSRQLPRGAIARDVCGDGTDEFRHIDPLVTWKNPPTKYFIESSVPSSLIDGVIESFNVWNSVAGFTLYERTMDDDKARIDMRYEPVGSSSSILAEAEWSYSPSRAEMISARITFDSRERYAILDNESCGSNGSTFDLMNTAVHEIGHISGLDHAPSDRLQTMYATTGPGVTLGRTLGNGDTLGFKKAYNIVESPPPPPPEPEPILVTKPKITTINNITYLNLAYENVDGDYVPIKTLTGTHSLPFNNVHAKIITIDGKQYVYLYYYRAANLFTTLGRIPLQ